MTDPSPPLDLEAVLKEAQDALISGTGEDVEGLVESVRELVDEIRAAVAAEREPLLDVIESCFSVGEIRFGHNGLATTVRGKVLRVLIDAGRIDESGAAIRAEDG